ncbi:MAG TPA: DUF433 domain-containing protein, partial [Gemmataceae bacterium]|nr:DUF433 domain-containing protein [Gemmataceae bacterium]
AIHPDPAPLQADDSGELRVGGTRVTLDTLIHAYHEGASAKQIALRYDSLTLADIHAVLAYYLRHRAELDGYLARRRQIATDVRRKVEARQGVQTVRERLTARLAPGESRGR